MSNHRRLLERIFNLKIASRTMTRKWSKKFDKTWDKCTSKKSRLQ